MTVEQTMLTVIAILLGLILLVLIGRNGRKALFLAIAAAFIGFWLLTGRAPAVTGPQAAYERLI
jgi:hypothetical protein